MNWLLIAAGGAVGAPARYLVDAAVSRRAGASLLPWGTLTINVLGSAILGALIKATSAHSALYALAATGFCGAFTTFSTFTWETFALGEDGYTTAAVMNVALSLTFGLGAAGLAYTLA